MTFFPDGPPWPKIVFSPSFWQFDESQAQVSTETTLGAKH
jgi:hypothetical protein